MDEGAITATSKTEYKRKIKSLILSAALEYLNKVKLSHRKLDFVSYTQLKIQPYLVSSQLSNMEKELVYSLRSHCHKSKHNFKKLHGRDINCSLGCSKVEDQNHIFTNCRPVISKLKITQPVAYHVIFGPLNEQIKIISNLMNIETTRNHMKIHLLPGGPCSQDHCKFSV